LTDEELMKISAINMDRIKKRVTDHYSAEFTYHDDVLVHIVARSQEVDTGARNIENILNRTLLPELASECLSKLSADNAFGHIHVGVNEEGCFTYEFS
jgi:type VI secretion system protein VasG